MVHVGKYEYPVVLVGEKHGIKENFDYAFYCIKKWSTKEELTLFWEIGYSAGVYLDAFLQGNIIFPLEEFVRAYQGTMLGSWDFMRFLLSLQKYNQRRKRSLHFCGIDLEHQKFIAEEMLSYAKCQRMARHSKTN